MNTLYLALSRYIRYNKKILAINHSMQDSGAQLPDYTVYNTQHHIFSSYYLQIFSFCFLFYTFYQFLCSFLNFLIEYYSHMYTSSSVLRVL